MKHSLRRLTFGHRFGRGWVLDNDWRSTVDAIEVTFDDLLAHAVRLEHALVVAPTGQANHIFAAPDALQADSTVEVLATLEEHATVREL